MIKNKNYIIPICLFDLISFVHPILYSMVVDNNIKLLNIRQIIINKISDKERIYPLNLKNPHKKSALEGNSVDSFIKK